MSWRALFIAASCCICRIIAVLGSEEALSESFMESMFTNVKLTKLRGRRFSNCIGLLELLRRISCTANTLCFNL